LNPPTRADLDAWQPGSLVIEMHMSQMSGST